MSGDRTGSQCGITSLLPMSCRGRAAAFARDLHTRLRHLGASDLEDQGESSWLTRDTAAHRPATSTREADTFYDFELECESPSSPVDEFESTDCSPTNEKEQPFYDVDPETGLKKQQAKLSKLPQNKVRTNGFTFSTSFFTDSSPVKTQPASRDNGFVDKRLFSPITFEGCLPRQSFDDIDSGHRPSPVDETDRLNVPISSLDSDSEFESAKSDPSECTDDCFESEVKLENDNSECLENLSLTEAEIPTEEVIFNPESTETNKTETISENNTETVLEITTIDVTDKELSPGPEIDTTLLRVENNVQDEDTEIDDGRPQRVRRCSSLKTGKTPPGTPGRKKIVRFADVLGLDLADVKTFMDEIPVIPKSAYDDLAGCDILQNTPSVRPVQRLGSITIVPLFQLQRDFTDKLERLNLCMESARVGDGAHVTVCGSVRVRNLDFHKTVHIRYTMNRWKTYTDLQATYVPGSCDGFSDRFQFVLYAPCISIGQRLEIAVRFQCKGQQFWDNNNGANYCFDCLTLGAITNISPSSSGPLHPTVDWHPSFY